MIEGAVQLVNGVRPKGVANLRSVEGDPHHRGRHRPVVGDVGEDESVDRGPEIVVDSHGPTLMGDRGHRPGSDEVRSSQVRSNH